jgi:hypothetical protein
MCSDCNLYSHTTFQWFIVMIFWYRKTNPSLFWILNSRQNQKNSQIGNYCLTSNPTSSAKNFVKSNQLRNFLQDFVQWRKSTSNLCTLKRNSKLESFITRAKQTNWKFSVRVNRSISFLQFIDIFSFFLLTHWYDAFVLTLTPLRGYLTRFRNISWNPRK